VGTFPLGVPETLVRVVAVGVTEVVEETHWEGVPLLCGVLVLPPPPAFPPPSPNVVPVG